MWSGAVQQGCREPWVGSGHNRKDTHRICCSFPRAPGGILIPGPNSQEGLPEKRQEAKLKWDFA